MSTYHIEINPKTILTIFAFILGFWLLFQIRSIIILIFVSFILMTAIRPLVTAANKIKIPTIVVVMLTMIILVGLMTTLIATLIPVVVTETRSLVQQLPTYLGELSQKWGILIDQNMVFDQFSNIPSNLLKVAAGAFDNIITILALFFIVYYLLKDHHNLHHYFVHFFGTTDKEVRAENMVKELEDRIGSWVRGEFVLMAIIGVMSYVGITLLQIPYALPLAILAGLLEAVPSLGPTISAVPTILLGLTISPFTAIGALAMSILIQQLENNLIVPKVMEKATGVNPLITIIVLMTGYTLAGIMGAVLAMPIYLTIDTFYKNIK